MANSTAKFYYRSFIDQDLDGYTLSGDIVPTTRINDRRKNTFATSDATGSGDGTSEEFIATFSTERTVDTIFLKSNFKTFTVYYWEDEATGSTGGGDYYEITSYASNTSDFLEISFDSITTDEIKIVCTHTITADEEKKIYMCEITQYINELALEDIKLSKLYRRENFNNLYGGAVQVIKYPNRDKIQLDLSWSNMNTTNYPIYIDLKEKFLLDALLIYIYFSDDYAPFDDEAIYLVNDTEDVDCTPENASMTTGVKASMKLREC